MPANELKLEFRKLWVKQRYSAIDLDSASTKTFRELTETLIEEITSGSAITLQEDKLPVSAISIRMPFVRLQAAWHHTENP